METNLERIYFKVHYKKQNFWTIEYTVYTLDDPDHCRIIDRYAPEIALGEVDFFVEVLALEH